MEECHEIEEVHQLVGGVIVLTVKCVQNLPKSVFDCPDCYVVVKYQKHELKTVVVDDNRDPVFN